MTATIVVDTDILIDVGRFDNKAVIFLEKLEKNNVLGISIITQMELFVGSRNKQELRELEKFVQRFQCINLNESIANQAIDLLRKYRLSHGLLIADSLIASTAIVSMSPLASKNQKDYKFISELELLDFP